MAIIGSKETPASKHTWKTKTSKPCSSDPPASTPVLELKWGQNPGLCVFMPEPHPQQVISFFFKNSIKWRSCSSVSLFYPENSPKQETGITEGQGPAGEEEEKKKQKRGKASAQFGFMQTFLPFTEVGGWRVALKRGCWWREPAWWLVLRMLVLERLRPEHCWDSEPALATQWDSGLKKRSQWVPGQPRVCRETLPLKEKQNWLKTHAQPALCAFKMQPARWRFLSVGKKCYLY